MWKTKVFEVVETIMGNKTLSLKGKLVEEDVDVMLTNAYGSHSLAERELFWEEIQQLRNIWSRLWCFGGDFSAIQFPSERRGWIGQSNFSEGFSDALTLAS